MLESCRLRNSLVAGQTPSFGYWQTLPGANVGRILARAGAEWVVVDCEHGNIDDAAMHEVVPAIAAAGASPIVRLPDMQGWMIKRGKAPPHVLEVLKCVDLCLGALDSGAHGILIPLLRNAEEAKGIVSAAKFPPLGRRGLGSPFAMERFKPIPTMTQYLQQANDALLAIVQIETQEALDSLEDIAAVPGIDVLFVGPFDLGNNIGFPILDGVVRPELEAAVDRILDVTHRAGKKAGFFAATPEMAKLYADKGFDMVSVALDATLLQSSLAASLSVAQGSAAGKLSGGY